ncbi:c-type cytochrome [Bacteroidota bacterium]
MKNSMTKIVVFLLVAVAFTSCKDNTKPYVQFMPDMYTSVAYEPYGENSVLPNGMDSQAPVNGTIARGQVPYDYSDSNEGYELAKSELKSPLTVHELDSEKGKALYGIYCAVCHGKKGDGQGDLVKREKFLGIPNYKDRDLTEGSIYHVIMYGRNLMGSHASQLTGDERWQVVSYVQKLRNDLLK